MRTIETTITITEDGRMTAPAPSGVAPGRRKVVLVLADEPERTHRPQRRALPLTQNGRLAENVTLSREELYDDTGR